VKLRRAERQSSTYKGPARVLLSAGMAACLVGALSLGSAPSATAAPLSASENGSHAGPGWGGPGWGGGHFGRPVVGTVVAPPGANAPTTFTMNVTGPGRTTTLVTLDVTTTTKLDEPGYNSPALANIMAGDQVSVTGTQAGTNTLDATLVRLLPPAPPPRTTPPVAQAPVLNASLAPSLTSYPDIYGVPPGGKDWALKAGHVVLKAGGQLDAVVTGLVLTATGSNPLPEIAASIYCNGSTTPATSTTAVPFSTAGDAHIHATVALPRPCLVPAVLLGPLGPSGTVSFYIAFDGAD
jgi:hypothetical protein